VTEPHFYATPVRQNSVRETLSDFFESSFETMQKGGPAVAEIADRIAYNALITSITN